MVAFYYVKNGGTATADGGRTTTQRTGAWSGTATEYYDSILDVFGGGVPTTAPAAGDIVCVAHTHSKTHTAGTNLDFYDAYVVSVDNANQENYLRGAKEITTTGNFTLVDTANKLGFAKGIDFAGDSAMILVSANGDGSGCVVDDCDLEVTSTNTTRRINLAGDGCIGVLRNTTVDFTSNSQAINVAKGSKLIVDGIVIADASLTSLVDLSGISGGMVDIVNCDLSNMATTGELIDNINANSADSFNGRILRSIMPSTKTLVNAARAFPNMEMRGHSIDFGATGSNDHQNIQDEVFGGGITRDTAIYRTLGAEFDGTNYSLELSGFSKNSIGLPIKRTVYNKFVDTANFTTTITVKVHLAVDGSSATLDDDEVWIEIVHSDGANKALGVLVSTIGDIVSPAAVDTETSLWTGLGGTNKQMSISKALTIGSSAGNIGSGVLSVDVCFANTTGSVFFCPKVELS